jgi:tripartite-type tricarboxylate transporter receptor subunit TctC
MNVTIRYLKKIGLGLMLGLLAASAVQAQQWPTRGQIRFVVPYPPGGASDVTARLIGAKLTVALGQSVVIENRPGANGIIALDNVARSAPDGYTLLMANLGPNAINAVIYSKLPFDPIKDFTCITLTSINPLVVLVNPALPIHSMKELIAYAQAHPNKLTFASAGTGAANHLAGEMMKSMAHIQMVHVPYKGDSPSIPDVISGTVSMMFPTLIGGIPLVKSGQLRAIAVTSAKRTPTMPTVPTVAESGIPNFEAVSWGGVMGPKGMPPEIVARLNTEILKILKMPDIQEKMSGLGAQVVGSTPQEFSTYLTAEIGKWGKVARESNIKLD